MDRRRPPVHGLIEPTLRPPRTLPPHIPAEGPLPTFHYAQLPDGRWIKLRELSSAQQATAYEACATKAPNGALLPPNPITLDHECFKLALVAVSVRKPHDV